MELLSRQAADELELAELVEDDELPAADVAPALAPVSLLLLVLPSDEEELLEVDAGDELLDDERESVR